MATAESNSLPRPTGQSMVGRTYFELIDHGRKEIYSTSGNEKRRLVVWVWYPAAVETNSARADYLPGAWSKADTVYKTSFGTVNLRCHSFVNPPAEPNGPYPVVLFSPAGFSALSYSSLMEELASHGYVAFGINHTYDAPVTVFDDGTVLTASTKFMTAVNSRDMPLQDSLRLRSEAADYKVQDLQFLATTLQSTMIPQLPASHLDLTRIAAAGHSLGGNASLDFCRMDNRCAVGVNLDGANWNEVGRIGVSGKPAMILAAEHPEYIFPCKELVDVGAFPTTEWCESERSVLWDGWRKVRDTANPFYGFTIKGSKHVNFADVQFTSLPNDSPFKAVMGSIDPHQMSDIVRTYLVAFFDKHLKSRSGTILDRTSSEISPDVDLIDF